MAPNKPYWIDQVKEVDPEEAQVLHVLGVEVFHDCSKIARDMWYRAPFFEALIDDWDFEDIDEGWLEVYYVRRGDDDKR